MGNMFDKIMALIFGLCVGYLGGKLVEWIVIRFLALKLALKILKQRAKNG